jgi:predicted DNA-binding transcriptional regulator YafY
LGSGYGIFAQGKVQWAQLRFSAYRARWVATEQWHPEQRGHFQPDGAYLLEVPYVDDRELVMDILRFGGDCEVVSPKKLRHRIAQEVVALMRIYED